VRRWKHNPYSAELLTVVVLVFSFAVLRPSVMRHVLPEPALRFLSYYEAAQDTSVKDSFWQRIADSLILSAGDEKSGQKETRR
jgi:hypothetical protein